MKYFNSSDLPLSQEMKNYWIENGYLVIENFYKDEECKNLIKRSQYLIEKENYMKLYN